MLFSKAPRLVCGQHRRFARFDNVFRSTDGGSRVGRDHLPDNQPVKELAQAGQILLDRGGGIGLGQRLNVAGHMQGLDCREGQPGRLAPVGKAMGRRHIR